MKNTAFRYLFCACVATAGAVACGDGSTEARPQESTWLVWTITTTGIDLDPNGYAIVVDTNKSVPASINETDSVRVSAGTHVVRLDALGSNCATSGTNPSSARVEAGQRVALSFAVSCSARQIAVTVDTAGLIRICILDRNGQGRVCLPDVPGAEYVESWSPDGTTLLYANIAAEKTDLWLTGPDGTNRRRLTNSSATINHGGSWSPDGRQIAYHSVRTPAQAQIFLMNADGSNQHAITDDPWPNVYPKWSPNGTRLVLYALRTTESEVLTMNPDGTDRRYLTPPSLRAVEPTWSPDGRQIAFVGTARPGSTGPRELYLMNADGSNIRQVTNTGRSVASPDWSPDGKFILFTEQTNETTMHLLLYSIADGSTQALPLTSDQILYPRWRP